MKTWKLLAYWITASGRDRWRLSFPKNIQTIPCHLGSVGGKCRSATSWCLLWPKILDQLTWMLQCCVTPEMSLPRAVAQDQLEPGATISSRVPLAQSDKVRMIIQFPVWMTAALFTPSWICMWSTLSLRWSRLTLRRWCVAQRIAALWQKLKTWKVRADKCRCGVTTWSMPTFAIATMKAALWRYIGREHCLLVPFTVSRVSWDLQSCCIALLAEDRSCWQPTSMMISFLPVDPNCKSQPTVA